MKMIDCFRSPAENTYVFLASLSKKGRQLYCNDLYERWTKVVSGKSAGMPRK